MRNAGGREHCVTGLRLLPENFAEAMGLTDQDLAGTREGHLLLSLKLRLQTRGTEWGKKA